MTSETYTWKPFKYSSHYWVTEMLAADKSPLRILDVGAATGYLGMALSRQGHYVAGIEQDSERAEQAKKHYHSFMTGDLEQLTIPLREEFDYILFADVLEHLRDPVGTLKRLLPTLKRSGKIIVSVPNVANWVVRANLLLGKFEYTDRGILDRTHLRFFTLRSLRAMLQESSCEVVELVATPLPVQLVWPVTQKELFHPLHEFQYLLVQSWKTLLGYQFVVKARPVSL